MLLYSSPGEILRPLSNLCVCVCMCAEINWKKLEGNTKQNNKVAFITRIEKVSIKNAFHLSPYHKSDENKLYYIASCIRQNPIKPCLIIQKKQMQYEEIIKLMRKEAQRQQIEISTSGNWVCTNLMTILIIACTTMTIWFVS